jgi:transcriptional/translational regulatory protein YebC/TACO1
MAIQNARGMNMPKDNVDRAIKKAAGGEEADFARSTYEGYAPGGIAIFVETATNNTTALLAMCAASSASAMVHMGTSGSLSHMFDRKAEFVLEAAAFKGRDLDELEMECIDGGADDVLRDEEGMIDTCTVTGLRTDASEARSTRGRSQERGTETRFRWSTTPARYRYRSRQVLKRLIDMLDEDEDVNAVYHNMDLTEEVEAELANRVERRRISDRKTGCGSSAAYLSIHGHSAVQLLHEALDERHSNVDPFDLHLLHTGSPRRHRNTWRS